jgi:3-hydroxyisobutyryl-CoA hydrolase
MLATSTRLLFVREGRYRCFYQIFTPNFADVALRRMSTTGSENHENEVLFERKGTTAIVTLNRPKALNALNISMIRLMTPRYKEYERDPHVKSIILKGAGDKAFCAGGDIRAIYDSKKKTPSTLYKDFFREEYILNYLIGTLQTPHIAFLNGITMGGGVGLSVHGKFRVATENTVFAMPETAIGFFCDVGGSYFLPRLPGELGMYLALTGARLKGVDVLKAGVATHYIPAAKLPQVEDEISKVRDSPADIYIDKLLTKFNDIPTDLPKSEIETHRDTIDRIFGKKTLEDIFAELKKENTEWANKVLETLSKMSPTSLKVVFKQLREGKKLSLDECLKMEYRISQRFMMHHDFFEGVRALLVDKDKNPKWECATIYDVSDADVQSYFDMLGPEELQLPEHTRKSYL